MAEESALFAKSTPADDVASEGAPPSGPAGDKLAEGAPPEKHKPSGIRSIVEWVVILGGAVLVAFIVQAFFLKAFYIPSESMVPTLNTNDRVLVNKLSYDLHDVHRGDIVVFKSPPGEAANIKDLIKRVVALPGETVEGRDGHILVNGRPIDESYLPKGTITSTFGWVQGCDTDAGRTVCKVPKNDIWVMGDNRSNSKDSRFFGPIPQSLIVGRAFVRVWPLDALGFL